MPTLLKKPRNSPGRPKTGRKRRVMRFTQDELDRLDLIRRKDARGVFLGKLIMAAPLNPFDRFKLLAKR